MNKLIAITIAATYFSKTWIKSFKKGFLQASQKISYEVLGLHIFCLS